MSISRKDVIDYVDSLEALGFKINKSDAVDASMFYEDVRISPYIDGRAVAPVKIGDLSLKDIDKVYSYQVKKNASTQVLRDLANAYSYLLNVYESGNKDEFDKETIKTIRDLNNMKNNNANTNKANSTNNTKNSANNSIHKATTNSTSASNSNNNNNATNARVVNVDNSSSAQKAANDGRKATSNKSLGNIIAAIIIGGSLIIAANIYAKSANDKNVNVESDKDISNETTVTVTTNTQETSTVTETNTNTNENNNQEQNENNNQENNNNNQENNTNEENENKNISSDESVMKTTNAIFDKVQTTNPNIVAEYDKKTIEALVRYTRHSTPEVKAILNDTNATTEEKQQWVQFTNQGAYDAFKVLRANGVDISMFFENLEAHDRISDLNKYCSSIVQEKNSYEDEFAAYNSMDVAVTKMDGNNFPEVIAIRAIVDETTLIPSMQLARDGAMEFGGEGDAYYNEKNSIDSSKKSNCRDIFNKVDINNQSAPLTIATFKAIDEDKNLKKSL